MITLDGLLQIAEVEKAQYEELRKIFPPGTINDARNDAYRTYKAAELCAEHMIQKEIEEAPHVGPFHTFKPQRGKRVRVVKGALVRSTHPKHPEGGKILTRSQLVTVRDFYPGYIDDDEQVKEGHITWAGSGGYWCWTDINNVGIYQNAP